MFLLHALLAPVSETYKTSLKRMAYYLWNLASSGEIPCLGDDDGGRLFHPYGVRRGFARATLASCAAYFGDTPWRGDLKDLQEQAVWWFAKEKLPPATSSSPAFSALCPDSGVAILQKDDVQAIVDTRGFGFGGAGHSHAHALHFTLRRGSTDVLIDPGTYTYVGDPAERDLFRGTRAHNTVVVDGLSQADPTGPFRWGNLPAVKLLDWSAEPWHLRARCDYRGIAHVREMQEIQGILFILDSFSGVGRHRLEQMWHPGGDVHEIQPFLFELPGQMRLLLPESPRALIEEGWYSSIPGAKESRPVICVSWEGEFPGYLASALLLDPATNGLNALQIQAGPQEVVLTAAGHRARFAI
jgi:hypothetical protein